MEQVYNLLGWITGTSSHSEAPADGVDLTPLGELEKDKTSKTSLTGKSALPSADDTGLSSSSEFTASHPSTDASTRRVSDAALSSESLSSSSLGSNSSVSSSSSNKGVLPRDQGLHDILAQATSMLERTRREKKSEDSKIESTRSSECAEVFPEFVSDQFKKSYPFTDADKEDVVSKVAHAIAWFYGNYLRKDGGITKEEGGLRPEEFPDPEKVTLFQNKLAIELFKEIKKSSYTALDMSWSSDLVKDILQEHQITTYYFPQKLQTGIWVKNGESGEVLVCIWKNASERVYTY